MSSSSRIWGLTWRFIVYGTAISAIALFFTFGVILEPIALPAAWGGHWVTIPIFYFATFLVLASYLFGLNLAHAHVHRKNDLNPPISRAVLIAFSILIALCLLAIFIGYYVMEPYYIA